MAGMIPVFNFCTVLLVFHPRPPAAADGPMRQIFPQKDGRTNAEREFRQHFFRACSPFSLMCIVHAGSKK
ncbi:MAG TPA: hypothetical protein DDX51_02270 [Clostridiales bacterium]|nr:hypothetical protein [Clostridiales bacterium]